MTEDERRTASIALAEKIHAAMKDVEPEAIAFCLVTLLESAPAIVMERMQRIASERMLGRALLNALVQCECESCKAKRGQA